ncbi:envelope protein UL78 [Cercopithecine betaherpesvirus 5]|uniref:Envelope protein UL78 n=1 Tax=Simian cytomegalovirus (strain Colburn) TaxID=50292 RepID=G8XTX4_SCMVC|nr:envelope protein UL78 [Cercopithecine betaherpesvirus 5]
MMFTEKMASTLLNGMMGSASFMILTLVVFCLAVLTKARLPYSAQIFTWNLVGIQCISIFSMLLSRHLSTEEVSRFDICRVALFMEDGCLYITVLLFMFLVLDRLAAFLNGRHLWRHQTSQNVEVAGYAVLFCWILGFVAAVPTAAVAVPNQLEHRGCQIPSGYVSVDMTIKIWFVFLAPVVTVLAVIIQISYHNHRDQAWGYASRVLVFYTVCFLMLFPYYYVRCVNSGMAFPNGTVPDTVTYKPVLDYVFFCAQIVADFRLVVFSFFIILLCCLNPLKQLDECFDGKTCQRICSGPWLRKFVHVLEKLDRLVTLSKAADTVVLTENEEPVAVNDRPVEVTVTPSTSAVFSTGELSA